MEIRYEGTNLSTIDYKYPEYLIKYSDISGTVTYQQAKNCKNVIYPIIEARDHSHGRSFVVSLLECDSLSLYSHDSDELLINNSYEIYLWVKDLALTEEIATDPEYQALDPSYTLTKYVISGADDILQVISWSKRQKSSYFQIYITVNKISYFLFGKFPDHYYEVTRIVEYFSFYPLSELEELLEE